jgi:hypothetical protein
MGWQIPLQILIASGSVSYGARDLYKWCSNGAQMVLKCAKMVLEEGFSSSLKLSQVML